MRRKCERQDIPKGDHCPNFLPRRAATQRKYCSPRCRQIVSRYRQAERRRQAERNDE